VNTRKSAADISDWIEAHRRTLPLGGAWLLGGEPNLQPAGQFASARLRVLIARLSSYHDVAAGITHSFLWQLAKDVPGTFVDLAYFPSAAEERAFAADAVPLWFGTTTREPAPRFDILAISHSVVQELLNLPAALANSGIALDAVTREQQGAPLVILGGSNSYATAILHGSSGLTSHAGLIDVLLIGDAEEAWPAFLRLYHQRRGTERQAFLREAARTIPGCLVPALYQEEYDENGVLSSISVTDNAPFPVRAARADLARAAGFREGPLFYDETTAGSSHLLISAGCPYFCSFCKESWEQKPYRERQLDTLIETASQLKANLGLREVSLMTFNVNTITTLYQLLTQLEPQFERVALKSQRFDAIAHAPHLLERQLEAGKRTYTCAMEGISDRLRRFLQKGLPETLLLEGFRQLLQRNLRQMKVFIIVTGREQEADRVEFAALLANLKAQMAHLRGKPLITFSLAALFRPPFTPLQFEPPRDQAGALETWMRRIEETVKKGGFECRISAGPWDALVSEYLAYADRRSTPILVKASLEKRFRYRGEVERAVYVWWQQELRERFTRLPFPPEPRTDATVFPWSLVDTGVTQTALYRHYQLLLSGQEQASCIAQPLGSGTCHGCGACPDPATRRRLTSLEIAPPRTARPCVAATPRSFRLFGRIARRLAPVGNRFLEAAFSRLLMRGAQSVFPDLTAGFGEFRASLPRGGAFGLFVGDFTIRCSTQPPWDSIIPQANAQSSDLEILQIVSASGSIDQLIREERESVIHLHAHRQTDAIARDIDHLLQKYRFKHQKRWENEILTWQIAPGQAKKCGFSQVRLPRHGGTLTVTFLCEPEPHLLAFFLGLGDREIRIPPEVSR